MKGLLSSSVLLVFMIFHSIVGYGQESFVTFETTNNSDKVCQDKTIGIIAIISPQFEKHLFFEWSSDNGAIKKVKNEIVTINTSNPGDKIIKFSLVVDSTLRLDTSILIKVLHKPDVSIQLHKNEIILKDKLTTDLESYKWVYNGNITNEFSNQSFINPKPGTYKVEVKNTNGCIGYSESVQIK